MTNVDAGYPEKLRFGYERMVEMDTVIIITITTNTRMSMGTIITMVMAKLIPTLMSKSMTLLEGWPTPLQHRALWKSDAPF